MTPEQKIKHAVLALVAKWNGTLLEEVTEQNVDERYEALEESDDDARNDALNEIREGEVETDLACEWSRHYESKSVAAKMPDGSWVGWTYWYGGGKHGEPEAIDWMGDAYDLTCVEEEKLVIVRTFSKVEA